MHITETQYQIFVPMIFRLCQLHKAFAYWFQCAQARMTETLRERKRLQIGKRSDVLTDMKAISVMRSMTCPISRSTRVTTEGFQLMNPCASIAIERPLRGTPSQPARLGNERAEFLELLLRPQKTMVIPQTHRT